MDGGTSLTCIGRKFYQPIVPIVELQVELFQLKVSRKMDKIFINKNWLQILAIFILSAVTVAWLTLSQLIESAYKGDSFDFINRIIVGQEVHPLQFYIDTATDYMLVPTLIIAFLSVLLLVYGTNLGRLFVIKIAPLLPSVLIIVITLKLIVNQLTTFSWGWDIEHMLYFGNRLLEGELHWTVEFDDKLPVVQILFAIPAIFNSIRVWQIISLVSILSCCISIYLLQIAFTREYISELTKRKAHFLAFNTAALVGLSFAYLPGGISHINPIAASFAAISIAFVNAAQRASFIPSVRFYGNFVAGSFFASLAIGIRPYYIYPLVLLGAWIASKHCFRLIERSNGKTKNKFFKTKTFFLLTGAWLVSLGAFGLTVNVLPFILTDRLDALVSGLQMLAQKLNPQEISAILKRQSGQIRDDTYLGIITTMWFLSVFIVPILILLRKNQSSQKSSILDFVFLVILCPLLLEIGILTKHFWPHYVQLFVPFIGLGIGFLFSYVSATKYLNNLLPKLHSVRAGISLAICIAIFPFLGFALASYESFLSPYSYQHRFAEQLSVFKQYLLNHQVSKSEFLNPSNMYFHRMLKAPRHGFPHAANTKHITKGWWSSINMPEHFNLPKNYTEYCEKLEKDGPKLIVELRKTKIADCLLDNTSCKYSRVNPMEDPAAKSLLIFRRID